MGDTKFNPVTGQVEEVVAAGGGGGGTGDMTKAVYDPANIGQQVVGTTAPQSLTNKTINDFTNFVDADAVHIRFWNDTGVTITAGTPIHQIGWDVTHQAVLVDRSRSDTPNRMPCDGLAESTTAHLAYGDIRVIGTLTGVDTHLWSTGDDIYVAPTGGLTSTKPTGANSVQVIATVAKQGSGSSDGVLIVHASDEIPQPATSVTTQVFGDTGTVGTAILYARQDHKHVMPSSTKDTTAVTGILYGNGSSVSAAVAGNFPTLNQSTTGTAAGLTAAYVDWSSGSGGNSILNKPTSLPASDVSAWAKAGTKPSYTASEISFADTSVPVGTTTGLMLGTSTTQKLGFFGSTPVVKPSAFTQTYSTATKTHAAVTQLAAPAGGTGVAAGGWSTAANRDLAIASINAARTDIANVKSVLNALIDDLQALGLIT